MELTDLHAFQDWLIEQIGPGYTVIAGPPDDTVPNQPDKAVFLTDYQGPPVPNWQGDYRVQALCRGSPTVDGKSAFNDAHEVADAVNLVVAPKQDDDVIATLSGGRRAILRKIGDINPMGADERGRWRFSINVALVAARV